MSKAFDTIQCEILLDDLKLVLDADEMHMFSILLKDGEIQISVDKNLGNPIITNIGSPQGDSASAFLFTFYLALTLKDESFVVDADHTYCKTRSQNQETIITPSVYKDHNYQISPSRIKYSHDQQYADDTRWISEIKESLTKIFKTIPYKLKQRNLFVNKSKAEQYSIVKNGSTEWKKCKYLGSMFDTESDIQRRKGLAFNSYYTIRKFLVNKKIYT